jgi:5-methylcytosine-specific restriction endonuclease McrA
MPAKINDGLTNKQRYIMRHKERLLKLWREQKRLEYQRNKEKILERGRIWRKSNKDKRRRKHSKQEYKAKYGKHSAYQRQYRMKNAEKRKQLYRDWYKRRPDKSKAKQAARVVRRRLLEKNAGLLSHIDIILQLGRQKGKCYWCRKPHGNNYHVDHVKPLAKGGKNEYGNIVIACAKCNLSKRDRMWTLL